MTDWRLLDGKVFPELEIKHNKDMIIKSLLQGKDVLSIIEDYCNWDIEDMKRFKAKEEHPHDEVSDPMCNCDYTIEGCNQVLRFVRLLRETIVSQGNLI